MAVLFAAVVVSPVAVHAVDLAALSLEQLMDLEVVVASRAQEPLFATAAAAHRCPVVPNSCRSRMAGSS